MSPMVSRASLLLSSKPWRRLMVRTICGGRTSSAPLTSTAGEAPIAGTKILESFTEEFEIGSRKFVLETGKIARFANGAAVLGIEETKVLSTVCSAKSTDGARDFLPLTVDYLEKQYAGSTIPSIFMRREGDPNERELLCGRLIDRHIRSLFPKGFYHDVQVMASVLSSDGKQDPELMAVNATSAALMLSDLPWSGPIGVIRIGRIDGRFVVNPSMDELSLSDLNLLYGCTKDKTLVKDVHTRKISERDLEAALRLAHLQAVNFLDPQLRLASKAGKGKGEYKLSMVSEEAYDKIRSRTEKTIEAVFTEPACGKVEQGNLPVLHGSPSIFNGGDTPVPCSGIQSKTKKGKKKPNIRIILKSFEDPLLEHSHLPPDTVKIGLPTTRKLYTVLRSPHIDKKSREQFQMKIKTVILESHRNDLSKTCFFLKRHRLIGALVEMVFWYKTRLPKEKLQSLL